MWKTVFFYCLANIKIMAKIELQRWGICIELDADDLSTPFEIDGIHDVLFTIKGVVLVEGPYVNGAIGISVSTDIYKSPDDAIDAIKNVLEGIGIQCTCEKG